MINYIGEGYAEAQKSIVMDACSSSEMLREAVKVLGCEIGRKVMEDYFLEKKSFETPMNRKVERLFPDVPLCAIMTTRDDFLYLRKGIQSVIRNSIVGYMDFEGRRGVQALNSEVRHMELPEPKGQSVHTLIVAKAVLATGCTALHLTKTAMTKYMPRNTIIASVFYSKQAVAELSQEIPNADIIVIGDPDALDENGMLVPGVGNLDVRLRA